VLLYDAGTLGRELAAEEPGDFGSVEMLHGRIFPTVLGVLNYREFGAKRPQAFSPSKFRGLHFCRHSRNFLLMVAENLNDRVPHPMIPRLRHEDLDPQAACHSSSR
jgi:hypothetical protein